MMMFSIRVALYVGHPYQVEYIKAETPEAYGRLLACRVVLCVTNRTTLIKFILCVREFMPVVRTRGRPNSPENSGKVY